MLDLTPIKTRLDRTLSELYEAADHGDSVSLSLAEVEVLADDVRALLAEVERLRKQVLGSIGASARELSWRARYMDQLAIVAELHAELEKRKRKDRAMLDFRATAKEAGVAQEKLPGALRELARENARLRALLAAVPVEFKDGGA